MEKNRLEAFSDGVLAIILTIMVLDLKVPRGETFADLSPIVPVFFRYVLSFVYVAIYWNNHHHLLQTARRISGLILWANLHLLFWLSLIPFATGWIGENHLAKSPSVVYGVVLLMSAVAYRLLQHSIIAIHGRKSLLRRALGKDRKGRASVLIYLVAIGAAFWKPWVAEALYVIVALMWLVPDQRIERALHHYQQRLRQHGADAGEGSGDTPADD